MKKMLMALIILLLSIADSAANSRIDISKSMINIDLNNIQSDFFENNSPSDPKIRLILSNDSLSQEIGFNIAVPPGHSFEIDYRIFASKLFKSSRTLDIAKPIIRKEFSGIRRGVDIYKVIINPFSIMGSDIRIIDSMSLSIKFDTEILVYAKRDIAPTIHSIFSDVINTSQVSGMLSFTKEANKTLSNGTWYDKDKQYLKITSKLDGVAKFTGNSIINLAPEWRNLPVKDFHLLYRGRDYPIFIQSGNGLLGDDATIYFLGKRAAGDTTWLDNYTDQEPFYLYTDANKPPVRLNKLPEGTNGTPISSVGIDYHLEDDSEYFLGTVNIYPRTDYMEGWYMARLNMITYNWEAWLYQFNRNVNFLPSPNEELEIKFKYATLTTAQDGNNIGIGGNDPNRKTNFDFLLNDNLISNISNDKWTVAFFGTKKLGKDLFAGANNLRVINRRIDKNNVYLGLDYITIQGKAKPFPMNGKAQFNIPQSPSDSKLSIPGFSSPSIIMIDTISNSIAFKQGKSGYRYAASAGNNLDSSFTLVLNDTIFRMNATGFAFAYQNSSNIIIVKSAITANAANNLYDELNSLPNGTMIVAVCNSNFALPSRIAALFKTLGSISISNLTVGSSWSFATIKGGSIGDETIMSLGISSIDGFFDNNSGNSYSIDYTFEANKDYVMYFNTSESVENCELSKVNHTDLVNDDKSSDLIIITHTKFLEPARKMKEYRESTGYKVYLANVEDIYKEYGFGKKSPHAIKAFLNDAYHNSVGTQPAYLMIVGDASWDGRKVLVGTRGESYVPSFGQPVSDYWYGLLDGDDMEPELIVGRIPVQDVEEAMNYYDKLISFESQPAAPWMKNFLFLSGGVDSYERLEFSTYRYDVFDYVQPYPMCGDTASVAKRSSGAGSEEEVSDILTNINSGTIWTQFFGHSSTQIFDMDGWHVEYLNNKDRYGFLSTLSCNAGAFGEPLDLHGRNEKYIVAKEKGFVAAFGTTGVGFTEAAVYLLNYMMQGFAYKDIAHRRAGDILYYGKSLLGVDYFKNLVTKEIFQLLGDPLLKIRVGTDPDLFIYGKDINVAGSGQSKSNPTEDDELVNVFGNIYNNGYAIDSSFVLRIIRSYKSTLDTIYVDFNSICSKEFFSINLPIKNLPGEHKLDITILSDKFEDVDLRNNHYSTSFYVYSQNLLPVDPLNNWNVSSSKPRFRFINPLADKFNFEYQFAIYDVSNSQKILVSQSANSEIIASENYIDWQSSALSLNSDKAYMISAKTINQSNGSESFPIEIHFFANDNLDEQALVRFKKASEFQTFDLTGLKASGSGNDGITISDNPVDFSLLSLNGMPTGEFVSWVRISIGNDVYVDGQYYRGFNVVVIPKNSETRKGQYSRFDTWDSVSHAENLIRLLRDTVQPTDYVLIATCDQSFRAMESLVPKTHIASIDTLREVMKLYGVEAIDSLHSDMSFAYSGFKGALPSEKFESFNKFDSVYVSGELKFYASKGYAQSMPVGPAKQWNSIRIDGRLDVVTESKISAKFFNPMNSGDTAFVELELGANSIENIDANQYPFSVISIELERSLDENANSIDAILFDFVPSPELALTKSKTAFETTNVLRGDSATLDFAVENLSLRSKSDDFRIANKVSDLSSPAETTFISLPNIGKDNSMIFKTEIPTASYDFELQSRIEVESPNYELYKFNNSNSNFISIIEDTSKPTAIISFDGKEVKDGDYISSSPLIKVIMNDNSRLKISNAQSILLRINGRMQTELNSISYIFESFGENTPQKAILTMMPDTLLETENSLFIYLSDASSNKDTIRFILKIARNGTITNHIFAPNPTIDQSKILFDVQAPSNEGKANIEIYSVTGTKVRSFETAIDIGHNEVIFDNRDSEGNMLAPGVYFYRIRIADTVYFEPVVGKFIVIR